MTQDLEGNYVPTIREQLAAALVKNVVKVYKAKPEEVEKSGVSYVLSLAGMEIVGFDEKAAQGTYVQEFMASVMLPVLGGYDMGYEEGLKAGIERGAAIGKPVVVQEPVELESCPYCKVGFEYLHNHLRNDPQCFELWDKDGRQWPITQEEVCVEAAAAGAVECHK